MSAPESPEFVQAQKDADAFTKKPTNDELLRLYALFKIGKGFDLGSAAQPGMFDLKGKAKHSAWKTAYEEEGITDPAEAQKKYVEFVEELKSKYA
ncbi:acyl-CoA-binding protein [Trichoderma velutinum]